LPYGPLRLNVTSSIKPEVHDIPQRRQKDRATATADLHTKFREDRFNGFRDARGQTDRQTHRQRSWSQYSAPLPERSKKYESSILQ